MGWALGAELPSLSWLAATPEKSFAGIRKLVKAVLADMASTGESGPEPIASKSYSGKFMVRVPPETNRMLAVKAAESGVSLNPLVHSKFG